jgi:AcrR family transcriptional regulator
MSGLTQVAPKVSGLQLEGLRSQKKGRTRFAIEAAALELFAEKGFDVTTVDEIAERAEASKATFFRYFRSKADVVFGVEPAHFEALGAAIEARPNDEHDLTAIRHAVLEVWVLNLDPERVRLQGRAAASSNVLRGMSFDLGVKWQGAIAEALARRHGLDATDQRCWLVAGIALSVCGNAINCWLHRGCHGDIYSAIDNAFALMIDVCSNVAPSQPMAIARPPRSTERKRGGTN